MAVAWPAERRVCARETHHDVYFNGMFISWHIKPHFDKQQCCIRAPILWDNNDSTTHFVANSGTIA